MKGLNRRNFLRTSAAGVAGIALTNNMNASNTAKEPNQTSIITRKLGNTGIELPVLSIGCGEVDSPAVIKAALKVGITHFDTAYRYQQGNSEKMLGKTLKDVDRDSFIISTKVVRQDTDEKFLEMLDESLARLQMDYVDILYMHGMSKAEAIKNPANIAQLQKAKDLGKAKHIGFSTHKNEPEVIEAAIEAGAYEVILTAINFKHDDADAIKKQIALASKKGIGIVAMKVMAGGYLDKEKTKTVNHAAALKWILEDEHICTTIPSMVNLEQLQINMAVLKDVQLSSDEKNDLALAKNEQGLFCNDTCNTCVTDCTKNLPVPELMRAYMYSYGYRNPLQAKELITTLNIENNPCDDCGSCTVSCTKSFDVAAKIKDISRLTIIPNDFLA
ncbi:aldo/keto reductase [Labilibacter marinus]|uniref:aldo/keto reductase n=1 Tax=Labilibacter marinus TaxID=1477105 RepID=UPI00094F9D29|nr:aldo/keto reductase [Labilibacter marinus]